AYDGIRAFHLGGTVRTSRTQVRFCNGVGIKVRVKVCLLPGLGLWGLTDRVALLSSGAGLRGEGVAACLATNFLSLQTRRGPQFFVALGTGNENGVRHDDTLVSRLGGHRTTWESSSVIVR